MDRTSGRSVSRRAFLATAGATALAAQSGAAQESQIQGFDEKDPGAVQKRVWTPISDRRIKVGIVGYGVCRFGAQFGFQNHPNVEVAAVSDLFPDRCAALAKACGCKTTYESLDKLLKDDAIEAVFLATDAPNHAAHAIACMEHGKHVACAVPAVWKSIEEAKRLYDTVKRTGLKYMLFETSAFRPDCYAMRQAYNAGLFGKLIYSEGQYYHFFGKPIGSYKDWRIGMPPMWYPTHATAYYVAVTGKNFTQVSCQGFEGSLKEYKATNNRYHNPFDSEVALFRTSEGGASRMSVCWGTKGSHGEYGHVRGELGKMEGTKFAPGAALKKTPAVLAKPPLPPGMPAGGHGGSHGYLTEEFVNAILQDRDPLINIAWSLNMTVPGIIAHQSALKTGENLKVPQFRWPA